MLQFGLLLISCLVVSQSYPTETNFAHHEIQIGYGMFVFMQWGFSAYFCLAEGKSYLHILCDTFALTDFAFAVILIWRLYVLYQSKLILYILLGSFLPIVALYIAMDIFLWSRPSSLSGKFLF
jgi:hypothetical protein